MKKQGFRRGVAGFLAISTMCAAIPAVSITAAQTLAGDVNLDGTVSTVDVVALQKYLLGKAPLSKDAFDNANVAADKSVTAFDLAVLKKMVLADPVSNEVTIRLSDNGIKVEGDDNKVVQITDKSVKITASGMYHVYGSITDGQLFIETAAEDTSDVELELNDVTMTGSKQSCIYSSAASGSEKTKITLVGENTLTDTAAAAYTESGVIYTSNKLTITNSSTGTLNINSNMNTGIYADKKLNLNGGTIVVNTSDGSDTAEADAIVGDNNVEIEGAVIDVDSSGDGIKSKDKGVFVLGGTVTIKAGKDAVQACTEIAVSDGTVTAGGDRGFRLDEAGMLNITGGKVIATATDYQITGSGVTVDLSGSTQPVMLLDMAAEWTKDNVITVRNGDKTVCEYAPRKKYSYVLISDPTLSASGKYNVFVGGTQMAHSKSAAGEFAFAAASEQFLDVKAMDGGTTVTPGTGDNVAASIEFASSGVKTYNALGEAVAAPSNLTVSGSKVTITEPSVISVSGTSTSAQIVVDVDKTTYADGIVELDLMGAELSNSSAAPIYVRQIGDEAVIVAKKDTVNTISDSANHSDTNSDGETIAAAIYAEDDLKIKGQGTLTVNGNYQDGIATKNDLKVYNGTLTVNAVDDALRGGDSVTVGNETDTDFSTLNITLKTTTGDGIKANDTDTTSGKGFITVNGGKVNVTAFSDGMHASQALNINGGDITVKTTGSSSDTNTSSKGLKAGCTDDNGTAVTGVIAINGGNIDVDSTDDCIHASGNITLYGGVMQLNSGDDAVHSDADVTIGKGNNTFDDVLILVEAGYEGIEGLNVTQNSGTVISNTTDDGYNAAGGADGSGGMSPGGWGGGWGGGGGGNYSITINGGFVLINTTNGDHDGMDSNGSLSIKGGYAISNGQEPFDCDGTLSYTGGVYVKNAGSGGFGGGMMGPGGMGGGSMTESVSVSASVSAGTRITICDGNGNVIVSFIADKAVSSVIAGCTAFTGATVYTGGTLQGSTYFQEIDQTQLAAYGGTLQGGTQASGSSGGNTSWQ